MRPPVPAVSAVADGRPRQEWQSTEGRPSLITVRGAIALMIMAAPLLVLQVGSADLNVYRRGAAALLDGGSLYAPSFALHAPGHLPFTYPPFAAVAAAILLPLPELATSQMWAVATVLMLVWCVRVSFRPLLDRFPAHADLTLVALTGALLWTRPVFDHLGDGQVDILLMTLCLADIVSPRPRWPRGALVGLAAAIKLVPGIFVPYLWLTGRRKAAAVAALTFVVCETVAAVADAGDSHSYWTHLIFDTERPGYTAGYKNQSLRGILLRVLSTPGRTFWILVAALIVAAIGLYRARRAAARGDAVAGATLAGLTGVLASPVSWIHATVWIIPAIGLLVGRLDKPVRIRTAATITVALAAGLPYLPNVFHGLPSPIVLLLHGSFGFICLGLALVLPATDQPEALDAKGT